ncbi:hypothetical protein BDA99DRAFT_543040 [Phascolomyces articulosus]|uniref:Uncharacterized protein n=1 Tax=Phascolomyces articulosus TaxID=60185 RepID=A0AAD5JPC7_9FUNG|nr:hypothetical protein BDA99DRAFT_543040 [Phascolomyces articulosus]
MHVNSVLVNKLTILHIFQVGIIFPVLDQLFSKVDYSECNYCSSKHNEYLIGNSEWSDGARSNVVLEPKSSMLSLPPIISSWASIYLWKLPVPILDTGMFCRVIGNNWRRWVMWGNGCKIDFTSELLYGSMKEKLFRVRKKKIEAPKNKLQCAKAVEKSSNRDNMNIHK